MRINCLNWASAPSVEDSDASMAIVIDKLLEVKEADRIILAEVRENEYDREQTKLLRQIAEAYNKILNEDKILALENLAPHGYIRLTQKRFSDLQFLVRELLRKDPIGAYVRLNQLINQTKIFEQRAPIKDKIYYRHYLENVLLPIKKILERCDLIKMSLPFLTEFKPGVRDIYRKFLSPIIRPNFMLTRFMLLPPKNGKLVEKYKVGNISVQIFKIPEKVRYIYHITSPEFTLSEEKYAVLDAAKKYLVSHKPTAAETVEPERMRELFKNLGMGLIKDLGRTSNFSAKEIGDLAIMLARYTAGFGVLELLLADEKIQDIFVNSPIGSTPIYVYHSDFEECETNLIPTKEDAEAWATRFRLYSGRPLDEANPVLDTELIVPGGRARVAAITRSLSPEGLAFAFRRHRAKPWTFPLLIKHKMFDPLYAGLMSFIVDGGRALLIAGGRGSGKTSILGALMLEIMQKFRICCIEDTLELPVVALRNLGYNIERMKARSVIIKVEAELPAEDALRTALRLGDSVLIIGEVRSSLRGDQEVLVVEDGITKRIPISSLENKDKSRVLVPTLDIRKTFKIRLEKLKDFVKHPKRDRFIRIITKTGREIVVTPEHSVFGLGSLEIKETEAEKLKPGDNIVIPSRLPFGYADLDSLNMLEILPDSRLENAEEYIRAAIKKIGWRKASEICGLSDIYVCFREKKSRIKASNFLKLMKIAGINYSLKDIRIKNVTSTLPAIFLVNEDFCRLMGYFVSEGHLCGNVICITNSDPEIIDDVVEISKKLFNQTPKIKETKGWGRSKQIIIQNSPLARLVEHLGCKKKSGEKRIPSFIYGLSENKISAFLRGLYSGDGSFSSSKKSGNSIRYFTTSKELANDLLYLLLELGIVAKVYEKTPGKNRKKLFIVEFNQRDYIETFLSKIGFERKDTTPMTVYGFPHSNVNLLTFSKEELLSHIKKLPRKYRHLKRFERCSKFYFEKIVEKLDPDEHLLNFAKGDFYVDTVKKIEEVKLDKPEYVYDLSVNPTENFIGGFGGILLHNTESLALFEAMRIGALQNVIAGTVHGESAYGVYDRIVHDLGVPPTSFKALDAVTICNMLRSPDGLHRFRRVTEFTEVRKHWKVDPMDEGGFVNLMEYSAKEDRLKPTDVLIDGESQVLDEIAKRVRDWHGKWDIIWDNILLRAKIKETMVDYSKILNRDDILEAETVLAANSAFHLISGQVKEEIGAMDSKVIFDRWLEWFKEKIS